MEGIYRPIMADHFICAEGKEAQRNLADAREAGETGEGSGAKAPSQN